MWQFGLRKMHCFGLTFLGIKKGIPDHIKALFFLPCHLTAALEMVDIYPVSLQGLWYFHLLKTGVYSWWPLLYLS